MCKWASEGLDTLLSDFARISLLAGLVALIIIVITYTTPQTVDNSYVDRTVSVAGLAFTVLVFWATSRHRKHINWRTVLVGLLVQFLLGVFVMRSDTGVSPPNLQFLCLRHVSRRMD